MTADIIRVGIIGASPDGGWAPMSHIPALQALPQYAITAVGTSRADSARRAAEQFGASHAFTSATELAGHPEVDLVLVAVKTPDHCALVRAALDAGKHVYCEWPLTRTTAEAEALVAAARDAGVHHTVGLQSRYAPAVVHARELIAKGYVGRLTSVTVRATRAKGVGGRIPAAGAYTLDRASGAGTLEVAGGHTLDLLEYLGGPLTRLSATLAVQQREVTVAETGQALTPDTADHVMLGGTLANGATAAMLLHDGKIADAGTRVEVCGTDGELEVYSTGPGGPRGAQVSELMLRGFQGRQPGAWAELPVPAHCRTVPDSIPGTAVLNVAQLYAELAEDIRQGTNRTPDFATGLRLHGLLDTVRLSAETGTEQLVPSEE